MLERSFDFKTYCSVRPNPAVSAGCCTDTAARCSLPVSKQDCHSPVEIRNLTLVFSCNGSIVYGTE